MNELYTGEFQNGYWIDSVSKEIADIYIQGCADGLYARRDNLDDPLCTSNLSLNRANVVNAVRAYYKEKPTVLYRQIVAVIKSGC